MKLLLPHKFKRYGLVMAPIGFVVWLAMQWGYSKALLKLFLDYNNAAISSLNSLIAVLSFFTFLAGIYFLVFSKEKMEDEMIQQTRLESFLFAALVQIVFIIIGFISMFVIKEPGEGGLILFFILLLFIFWISFIGRFNYMLHIRIKQLDEKQLEG
jgi:heme/copper-type cytochrome/quinol oxidase subunit 4